MNVLQIKQRLEFLQKELSKKKQKLEVKYICMIILDARSVDYVFIVCPWLG